MPDNQHDTTFAILNKQLDEANKRAFTEAAQSRSICDTVLSKAQQLNFPELITRSRIIKGHCLMRLGQYDAALNALDTAIRECDHHHFDYFKTRALLNRGHIDNIQGHYEQALDLYHECWHLAQIAKIPLSQGDALCSISMIYHNLGDYETALSFSLKALQIADQNPDLNSIREIALNNIGLAYKNLNNPEQALTYFDQMITLSRKTGNQSIRSNALSNKCLIHLSQNNVAEASKYAHQSLELNRQTDDQRAIAISLHNIALVYRRQNKNDKARDYFEQSQRIFIDLGDRLSQAQNCIALAELELDQSKPEQALQYIHNALSIGQQLNINNICKIICQAHHAAYRAYVKRSHHPETTNLTKNNMLQQALKHLEKYTEHARTRFNEETDRRIRAMQIRFETHQKERENQQYRQQIEQQERELKRMTTTLATKNNLIRQLHNDILNLKHGTQHQPEQLIDLILTHLQNTRSPTQDWQQFKEEFNQIYPEFLAELARQYPKLTRQELKISALIRINLTSRQIANTLYISKRSVDAHRYNIRKKLNLDPTQSLTTFLQSHYSA